MSVSLELGGAPVAVDLMNLSETGAYLRGPAGVSHGSPARLSFTFGGGRQFEGNGAVVRTDGRHGIGLRFAQVNDELRGFVRTLTGR